MKYECHYMVSVITDNGQHFLIKVHLDNIDFHP